MRGEAQNVTFKHQKLFLGPFYVQQHYKQHILSQFTTKYQKQIFPLLVGLHPL